MPQRQNTNPLDLAVMRLAALEQNVERRYLREPLWAAQEVVVEKALLSTPDGAPDGTTTEISYEITPRVRVWRQTLERCRSAAQVCLCMGQLERSIAWEKSVNKVVSVWDARQRGLGGVGSATGRGGRRPHSASSQLWSRPAWSAGRATMTSFSCSAMAVTGAATFIVIGPRWRLSQKETGSALSVWPR